MACTITHFAPGTRSRIGAFLNRVGQGMDAQGVFRPDRGLVAKSEKETARMDLTRDRIGAPVFRDTDRI